MPVKFDQFDGGDAPLDGSMVIPKPVRLVSSVPIRWVLVTLNASNRSASLCFSLQGILNDLVKPISSAT